MSEVSRWEARGLACHIPASVGHWLNAPGGQEEEGQCKLLDTSALLKWRLWGRLLKRAAGVAS